MGTTVHCLPEWQAPVWVLTGFACYSARRSRSYHAGFRKCIYPCCACYSPFPMLASAISRMEIGGIRRLVCPKAKRMDAVNGGAAVHLDHRLLKAPPHNSAARRAMSFPPSAACKFLDLPPVNFRNLHLHLTKNPFVDRPPHLCGVALNKTRRESPRPKAVWKFPPLLYDRFLRSRQWDAQFSYFSLCRRHWDAQCAQLPEQPPQQSPRLTFPHHTRNARYASAATTASRI